MIDLDLVATLADDAARHCKPIAQFSQGATPLSLEDAYKVQGMVIQRRLARGEAVVGLKMGFTSRAKMAQMGVHDLICGQLTDAMIVEEGGDVAMSRFIHPRVEPELAFMLKRPLEGCVTLLEAQSAVESVAPALEIIDSRYENFKFSLEDVVADNSSSSAFAIGAWRKPVDDISNLGMVLSFDGSPVQIGSSAGLLGNPYRSLVAAARLAAQAQTALQAGWIVMAGAATAAEAIRTGLHVTLDVEDLGRVEFATR